MTYLISMTLRFTICQHKFLDVAMTDRVTLLRQTTLKL